MYHGQEIIRVERLRHIGIGPDVETLDLVLHCGVEDRILVWNPDDFEAAEADYTLNELCSDVQNYSDKTPGNSSAASLISSAFGG